MRRRVTREAVLQIMYSLEGKNPEAMSNISLDAVVEEYYAHFGDREKIEDEFLRALLIGTLPRISEFDQMIKKQSEHWRLERMAIIDRNILRFSLYELLYFDDVPSSVTINEAVEVAKKFGTEESSAFVNGILDQIWKHLPPNPNKLEH